MKAIEVFEQSMRCQVENFSNIVNKRIQCRKESDVQFVFTVPTHSNETVHQMVFNAALRVSIFKIMFRTRSARNNSIHLMSFVCWKNWNNKVNGSIFLRLDRDENLNWKLYFMWLKFFLLQLTENSQKTSAFECFSVSSLLLQLEMFSFFALPIVLNVNTRSHMYA